MSLTVDLPADVLHRLQVEAARRGVTVHTTPVPVATAIERLARRACAAQHHEFWPCDVSVLDPAVVDSTVVVGPKQVTDVYLLATAVANGGRFVTFDTAVPLSGSPGS